ncbi:hypothetical protein TELCIR_16792 [Teladorsagia circumcincta]|uniref:Uncharacterized protein n=1 Tax=Teladorsagia circumcincta TaxID=45464 RepID=A0A2G9TUR9_TELCI|nr:hypothetical protein TELCIR_16792 [Teladorsagia circumcincta]
MVMEHYEEQMSGLFKEPQHGRRMTIWPDRPEFGRYSLEYEYLDQKRIKTEREKRERKRLQFLESEIYQSPDLVPSEILRSSCSFRQERSAAGSTTTSVPSFLDKEMRIRMGSTYHFLGSATDQQALSALEVYPFVVFMSKGTSDKKLRVGFHVGGEARLFSVEMLNIEKGGTLWRITGTTYSIG